MPLQSKHFQDQPKLEAALTSDHDHIIPGATGDHVSKIQSALFILNNAKIESTELENSIYGPSTSQAVFNYKTDRKIINLSYQNKADSIVGRMTIDALDKEILAKEKEGAEPFIKSEIKTVKFIINAFIPKDVPGVTFPVTNGPHIGSTFVFGPPIPGLIMPETPPINPFLLPVPMPVPAFPQPNDLLFRPAFLTNNRSFSLSDTRLNHHFKMHAEVTVSFESNSPRIIDRSLLGGLSIQIEPVLGTVIQTGVSSNSRMHLTQVFPVPAANPFIQLSPNSIALRFDLATSIPLIPGSGEAGDIDMTGLLVIDGSLRTISFDGFIDNFPAFEAIFITNGTQTTSFFQIFPLKGQTPLNLTGPANNPVNLTVLF